MHALSTTILVFTVVAAFTTPLAVHFLREYVKRLARQSLDKELETHRQQLRIQADTIRAEHERRLQDFNIYTRERHRAYAGVYKRLLMAEGAVNLLGGVLFEPTYEGVSRDQIASLLTEKKIPHQTEQEILTIWDKNNEHARRLLSDALHRWKRGDAHQKLTRMRNYQLLNELYFSDGAQQAVESAYQSLVRLWVYAKDKDRDISVELHKLRTNTQGAIVHARDVLRQEMRRGDYSLPTEPPGA